MRVWNAAFYCRLSREDGDKPESNSIAGQKRILEEYAERRDDLRCAGVFQDDGYTGTNFERPGFQAMLGEIEAGRVDCVMVKDLSRFGRDYIDTGQYLERWFPSRGVRFIAVGDGIDRVGEDYDLLLPFKNVFNEHYARDISQKVRSSVRAKQEKGLFVGAFASYGYRKVPGDRNRLEVDPVAAAVVRRIFALYEGGMGKLGIAGELNREGIPCPSEYKRLCGEHYRNGQRGEATTYWTYATIHRMLQNRMYAGMMEQGKAPRAGMHGRAKRQEVSRWAIVPGTHEAIIPPEQFQRVQELLGRRARQPAFQKNVSPFAGFLRCGDCGRAMSKTVKGRNVYYQCGSYKRYGRAVCTRHSISHRELEGIVLGDLNRILGAVGDLGRLVREALPVRADRQTEEPQRERLQKGLERLYRLKKAAYEDYREGILTKEDFLRYREDYERQERALSAQMEQAAERKKADGTEGAWGKKLLESGKITVLDRAVVTELIDEILVFEDGVVEVTYAFADDGGIFSGEAEGEEVRDIPFPNG